MVSPRELVREYHHHLVDLDSVLVISLFPIIEISDMVRKHVYKSSERTNGVVCSTLERFR